MFSLVVKLVNSSVIFMLLPIWHLELPYPQHPTFLSKGFNLDLIGGGERTFWTSSSFYKKKKDPNQFFKFFNFRVIGSYKRNTFFWGFLNWLVSTENIFVYLIIIDNYLGLACSQKPFLHRRNISSEKYVFFPDEQILLTLNS